MNCPLCGVEMGELRECPECGTTLDEELPEEKLPGIYYDNLLQAQEVYEEEHKPPEVPRFDRIERRILTGAVLLLVLVIGLLWWGSEQYDPNAVAIRGDGGIRMDNRTFSIYYQNTLQRFVAQYNDTLPFDRTRSLAKQYYNLQEGYSWEDYFVEQAFSSAALTQRLAADARAHGHVLTQAEEAELDSQWEAVLSTAAQNAMAPEAYLSAMYGDGITTEAYQAYLRDNELAQSYSEKLYYDFLFSEEELQDYYAAHLEDYEALTISELPNADVRHVLYLPESDEEVAAEALMEMAYSAEEKLIAEGATEEAFMALAKKVSGDAGSREQGGLLENLAPGQLSQSISDWCFFSGERSYGDLAVLESDYGIHLMFFVRYRDNYRWKEQVMQDMRSEALGQYLLTLGEKYDCTLTRFAAGPK